MYVHLASVDLDGLLFCTKGCLNKWFDHTPSKLKSKFSESESNFLNDYVCVLFSFFWRDFYITYDTIIAVLIVYYALHALMNVVGTYTMP